MSELTVHLRVVDAASGRPTPVRFCIRNAAGHCFAPLGRSVDFPIGRAEAVGGQVLIGKQRWFYINGNCEIPLPTLVPLTIEITKGILYRPVVKTVTLGPGQMALRFEIEKGIEPEDHVFVDSRAHFLTPHDTLLEAQAEGLDTVELLIAEQMVPGQDGKLYPTAMNLAAFSGQEACLEREGTEVFVNTLNAHPALGKLALCHSHRPIFPLAFGEESDDWSLADWCAQCHRKKGYVVWVDALTEAVKGGEALVNAVLGTVDAIELDGSPHDAARLKVVYHLWNLGIDIVLLGGSGKSSNRTPLGSYRTGLALFSHGAQDRLKDISDGWSYVTTGPLLFQEFNDQSGEGGTYTVRAECLREFESLDVIRNGELMARATASRIGGTYRAELEVPCRGLTGWIAAKIAGRVVDPLYGNLPFAHSSRFVIGPNSNGELRETAAVALRPLVAAVRDWIETQGHFRIERRRERLLELAGRALQTLEIGRGVEQT